MRITQYQTSRGLDHPELIDKLTKKTKLDKTQFNS